MLLACCPRNQPLATVIYGAVCLPQRGVVLAKYKVLQYEWSFYACASPARWPRGPYELNKTPHKHRHEAAKQHGAHKTAGRTRQWSTPCTELKFGGHYCDASDSIQMHTQGPAWYACHTAAKDNNGWHARCYCALNDKGLSPALHASQVRPCHLSSSKKRTKAA